MLISADAQAVSLKAKLFRGFSDPSRLSILDALEREPLTVTEIVGARVTDHHTVELSIQGMDCAECSLQVQRAIAELPGVESVNVFVSSEKAVIRFDPVLVDLPAIHKAVEGTLTLGRPQIVNVIPLAGLAALQRNVSIRPWQMC